MSSGKFAGAKWFDIVKRFRWLMIRRSILKADKVIAVAQYLKPVISNLTGRNEMTVIYNITRMSQNDQKVRPFSFSNDYTRVVMTNEVHCNQNNA